MIPHGHGHGGPNAHGHGNTARIAALENAVVGLNTWRADANDAAGLNGLADWRDMANRSLLRCHDSRTETRRRLNDLERHKGEDVSRLEVLEKWKTEDFNLWRKSTETRIEDLMENKLCTTAWNNDRNKLDSQLNKLAAATEKIATAHSKHAEDTDHRFDALQNKTSQLEARVSGHDEKIKAFDGELSKVRSEIKKSNKELGDRIDGQGTEMKKEFKNIGDMLETLRSTKPRGGNIRTSTTVPGGGGDGPDGSPEPGKGPDDRTLTKYQSNYESPGGINVANYGQLSVQHTPKCTRFMDSFNSSYSIKCPCQIQSIFPPQSNEAGPWCTTPGICPLRRGSWEDIEGIIWSPGRGLLPAPHHQSSRSYERRREKRSETREGSSNYNHTPSFILNLGRTSGGGLFSKPKREDMSIALGSGGGGGVSGRRKHKSRDDSYRFS